MLHEVEDEYVYISVQREQIIEVDYHKKSVCFIKGLSVYIICKELYTISNGTC